MSEKAVYTALGEGVCILVKERFENNHFIAGVKEGHESTEHAYQTISSYPSLEEGGRGSSCISPSLAPVVMVTSVSGSSCLLKDDEYTAARAFLRRCRPYVTDQSLEARATSDKQWWGGTFVGEYWLQSIRFSASFAASKMNWGGLKSLLDTLGRTV
jgi:hypothetical protein